MWCDKTVCEIFNLFFFFRIDDGQVIFYFGDAGNFGYRLRPFLYGMKLMVFGTILGIANFEFALNTLACRCKTRMKVKLYHHNVEF